MGSNVLSEISTYSDIAQTSNCFFISSNDGTTAKYRVKVTHNKKNMFNMKLSAKRVGRTDLNNVRKYLPQNRFVEKYIQDQWELGDPATRASVVQALRTYVIVNPQVDPDQKFYDQFLREEKKSNLANFISRAMKRIGYSHQKNGIGQTVPDNWYEEAKSAAEAIR